MRTRVEGNTIGASAGRCHENMDTCGRENIDGRPEDEHHQIQYVPEGEVLYVRPVPETPSEAGRWR